MPSISALWVDRSGSFSLLKLSFLIFVVTPGLWLLIQLLSGQLYPLPEKIIIRESGLWAIRLLMLSLLISPLRKILYWPQLIVVRRMIGVSALIYTSIHILAWGADLSYEWTFIEKEIFSRFYLLIGMIAFLLLLPLGITSTDNMLRHIGAKNWKRLHKLIYLVGIFAILHFYLLLEKLSTPEAQILVGLFIWMMGWRLLIFFNPVASIQALFLLGVVSGFLTMGIEILYFKFFTTLDASYLIWSANWSIRGGLRPGWIVMIVGVCFSFIGWCRRTVLAPK